MYDPLSLIYCQFVKIIDHFKHRGSYMSAHVVLNLLNELWKRDFYLFFATC